MKSKSNIDLTYVLERLRDGEASGGDLARARNRCGELIEPFFSRGGKDSELASYLLRQLSDEGITTDDIQEEFRRSEHATNSYQERRSREKL